MSVTCMPVPVSRCLHSYPCARPTCSYSCPEVHSHTRVHDLHVHIRVQRSIVIPVCTTCMSIHVPRYPHLYRMSSLIPVPVTCLSIPVFFPLSLSIPQCPCDHVHTRIRSSVHIHSTQYTVTPRFSAWLCQPPGVSPCTSIAPASIRLARRHVDRPCVDKASFWNVAVNPH